MELAKRLSVRESNDPSQDSEEDKKIDIALVHKKTRIKTILKYLKVCSRCFIKGFDFFVYRISMSICRYTMNLLITCFLLGLTEALVINENAVFHKENEVALTRSIWLFTLVIDLNPYENFLMRLAVDVENAANVAGYLVLLYGTPRQQGFLNSFIGLQKESQTLQDTHGNRCQNHKKQIKKSTSSHNWQSPSLPLWHAYIS